ncbi:MAG: kelch repeat-containing protein, partial [Methanoculleus sp.]
MISFHKYISLTKFCLVIPALLLLVGIATAAAPTAAFSGTPTSGAAPLTVSFTDLSAGSPTGWAWFFGDETYTGSWTEQNASSGWMGRNWHSSVALPDGSILVMGGAARSSGYQNDTWRSDDNGATWMPMNMSSGWSRRGDHSSVALPDGSVLVMGGADLTGCMNDTWRSTDGGATWTSMNMSSGWTARTGSTAVTLPDGSIILTGGQESAGDSVEYRNDVWRSGDNGATWTNITPSDGNPWTARAWHTSVAMPDGSILLMGGDDGSNRMNDVWRSDDSGVTWTQLPDAGWAGRAYHTSVVMPDGSILLMGGYNTGAMNDVWRSDDNGITWMQLPDARWSARQNPTAVALPDGSAIVMGGWLGSVYYSNDTWRFQPAGSTEENPTHTYTTPGIYTVALQAFNSDGYNATRMTDYITVQVPPTAAFSGTPRSGTAPLTVRFT